MSECECGREIDDDYADGKRGRPEMCLPCEVDALLEADDLESRVRELEAIVEQLVGVIDQLVVPGVTTTSTDLEDLQLGRLPLGRIVKSKTSETRVEEIVAGMVDADTSVSLSVSRDDLLPIHSMSVDLTAGNVDAIPTDSARRGARLFDQMLRRASGDAGTKVSVSKDYYMMDSMQARDVLVAADDVTDGGVSKTVARAMRAVQRYTKREDCECSSIGECEHGLVIFDDSSDPNRLRAEKADLHHYGNAIQDADDDGEQPSEASQPADPVRDPGEAADELLADLDQASPLTANADTVVSELESKASDQPFIPDS